jgi:hypothetical protein
MNIRNFENPCKDIAQRTANRNRAAPAPCARPLVPAVGAHVMLKTIQKPCSVDLGVTRRRPDMTGTATPTGGTER